MHVSTFVCLFVCLFLFFVFAPMSIHLPLGCVINIFKQLQNKKKKKKKKKNEGSILKQAVYFVFFLRCRV